MRDGRGRINADPGAHRRDGDRPPDLGPDDADDYPMDAANSSSAPGGRPNA